MCIYIYKYVMMNICIYIYIHNVSDHVISGNPTDRKETHTSPSATDSGLGTGSQDRSISAGKFPHLFLVNTIQIRWVFHGDMLVLHVKSLVVKLSIELKL